MINLRVKLNNNNFFVNGLIKEISNKMIRDRIKFNGIKHEADINVLVIDLVEMNPEIYHKLYSAVKKYADSIEIKSDSPVDVLFDRMDKTYRTIVFEGMDGTGKQTHSTKLHSNLPGYGFASFPDYDSPAGKLVKEYLVDERIEPRDLSLLTNVKLDSLSYALDRQQWAAKNNLKLGDRYIFDRYYTSNILYQTIELNTDDLLDYVEWLEQLEVVNNRLNRPDIVFCLISDPVVNMKNIALRGRDTDHFEVLHMQVKVYDNAKRLSKYLGWKLINVHNNNGQMRSIDDIYKEIEGYLCK